ncbi:MAG: VPLPA-CTERM-specific exosortase XrtD [Thiotrichaceae bacterium]|nr:MAG: VPLPA-CTERM-specific exosortase XrtD [Thiotrichaceae bacterium]
MSTNETVIWRANWLTFSLVVVVIAMLYLIFADGLSQMVNIWNTKEEYGHGYMIPFIIMFLIWQKKDVIEKLEFNGSWLGVIVCVVGLLFSIVGELASHYAAIQYAFVIVLFGLVLSMTGKKVFAIILVPLMMLFFMIPLPNFVFNTLSAKLQLVSSEIGVAVIRLFDISVYLEGNVIDLGVYKLQVVEACSGLNYLFPLMTLGFMTAYFFTGAFWKKVVLFLSTIPITILMNSLRIGVIGVMVEYWGIEMAEGFLHDFEGWAVFMSCIGILILEMWLLAKIGKDKLPLREAFGLDFPEDAPESAKVKIRRIPVPFVASMFFLAVAVTAALILPDRVEIIPERKQFAEFPLEINGWKGRALRLEKNVIDVLDLSDYTMSDYVGANEGDAVNFYSAYYESQRKGASIHSPKACIPGGGWEIKSITDHLIDGVTVSDKPLVVRRLLTQKGDIKQLVYYWFQQRGRVLSHEYLLKWYLFYDAVTMNRSDGALMRVVTTLQPGQDIKIADDRLHAFLVDVAPIITEYVPD